MSDFLEEKSIMQYPEVFAKMNDIKEVSKARDQQYHKLNEAVKRLENDNFFSTSTLEMVERLEKMAKIEAKPEQESLDFRRIRLQNRFNLASPYTSRFFAMKFDEIIGVGKWKATINKERTILTLECNAENQAWYEEIEATVSSMIPQKMRFVNTPYTRNQLEIKGSIDSGLILYGYALGSWALGTAAFGKEDMKNIVGGDQMVLTENYLEKITKEMLESITKARINGSVEIEDVSAVIDGKQGSVSYFVPQTTASSIEKIELIRSDDTVVSSATVYIPLASDVKLKHNFEVKEGE